MKFALLHVLFSLLSVRQIKSTKDKNAIAAFALPDEPLDIEISKPSSKDQVKNSLFY